MSTRGLYGFRKNGQDKLIYNHWDSYPEGLGIDYTHFIQDLMRESKDGLDRFFDLLWLVDGSLTDSDREYIRKYNLGEPKAKTWGEGIWNLTGNWKKYLDMFRQGATIPMRASNNFILDSLFCEYAYIMNLDTEVLEYWIGFQRFPQPGNRYGEKVTQSSSYEARKYYPCAKVCEIPLEEIEQATEHDFKSIVAAMLGKDTEE